MSNGLSYQENLLISKHLVERCKNAANDVNDWRLLRIKHQEEIQVIGLLNFDKWESQRISIAQLGSAQLEKLVALKERQRKQLEDMTYCE